MALTARLHEVRGATEDQRRFIERAVSRLGEALADPGLLPAIDRAQYTETRWTPLHGQWRSLTELVELPGPESGRQVLGSTALGCRPIHPSIWFVDRCREAGDAVNLASHFMHEWMHVSGFYHWPDNKARGDVAYVVGRLVREALEPKYAGEIDRSITALMHDVETDCGCRGNPEGGTKVGPP